MEQLDQWVNLIMNSEKSDEEKIVLKNYVSELLLKGLPVIFDLAHLSILCGINKKVLSAIINNSSKFYYQANIPKKVEAQDY